MRSLVAFSLVFAFACEGDIGETDPGIVDIPDPPEVVSCDGPSPPLAGVPVRILTSREYNNALATLFPDVSVPSQTIPFDGRIEAFVLNSRDAIIPEHITAFRTSVEEVSEFLMTNLGDVTECAEASCASAYIADLAGRAFRRAPTSDELSGLDMLYTLGAEEDHAEGMRFVFEGLLQSPSFLYVHETTDEQLAPHEVAQRMSAIFSRNVPDDALLAAAADGSLMDPAVRAEHAERLMDTDLGRAALAAFVTEWFGVDRLLASQIGQDRPELTAGFVRETELFVEELMASGSAEFTSLLNGRYTYLNAEMAEHYGLSLDGAEDIGEGWFRVALEDGAGILTQGSFLAVHGNPVTRGLTIRETILCGHVPGPDDIDTTAVETYEGESERSKSESRLEHNICGSCHARMDPLGLVFEGYDGLGVPRVADEHGNAIATDGALINSGTRQDVSGPGELGDALAESRDVKACVARQLFAWSYGRTPSENDACFVAEIRDNLDDNRNDLRTALINLVTSDIFLTRQRSEP